MKISELFELVKKEYGQFIPDGLEWDLADFKDTVEKQVLPTIGKHKPITITTFIQIINSPYIFTTSMDGGIPDWVSDVGIAMTNVATSIMSVLPLMYRADRRTRLWYYEKPKLWTFMFGQLMVQGGYIPRLEAVTVESGEEPDWEITKLLDNASPFMIDLAAGHFIKAIGLARRIVTFPEFPIATDAASLVEEGQRLIDSTVAQISLKESQWYLAI